MDGRSRSRTTTSHALRAASLVLAAAAFFSTAAARADGAVPVDAGQVHAASDIAKTYWHATPCADQVAVGWSALDATVNATSTWSNPVDAYSAPEQNAQCSITFNSALSWDWTRFCSILVHEYGHLTGHPHSADPADVMYAYYVAPVAECVAAAPAEPATAPSLTASAAALPPVAVEQPKVRSVRAHRVKRATLVVVREPRRLHGKPMRHRSRRSHPRMHRARV